MLVSCKEIKSSSLTNYFLFFLILVVGTFIVPMASAGVILGQPNVKGVIIGSNVITNGSVAFHVVMNNTIQTLSGGNVTKANFTAKEFDTTGGFNLDGDNYTVSVQGFYWLSCTLKIANSSNVGTSWEVFIYKNGVPEKNWRAFYASGAQVSGTVSYIAMGNVNDQFDCRALQNAALLGTYNSTNVSTYFSGSLLTVTAAIQTIIINQSGGGSNFTCTAPDCINQTFGDTVYMFRNGTNAASLVNMTQTGLMSVAGNGSFLGTSLTLTGVEVCLQTGKNCPVNSSSGTNFTLVSNDFMYRNGSNGLDLVNMTNTTRFAVSGNGTFVGTSLTVRNTEVCLQDGHNCPVNGSGGGGNTSVEDRMFRNGTNSLQQVIMTNTTKFILGTGSALYYFYNDTDVPTNELNPADDGSIYALQVNANHQPTHTIVSGDTINKLFCVDAQDNSVNVNLDDRCLSGFIPDTDDGFHFRVNESAKIYQNITILGLSATRDGSELCSEDGRHCPLNLSGGGGGFNFTATAQHFMFKNGTNADTTVNMSLTTLLNVGGNITANNMNLSQNISADSALFRFLGILTQPIKMAFFTEQNVTNQTVTGELHGAVVEDCSALQQTNSIGSAFMQFSSVTFSSVSGIPAGRNGSIKGFYYNGRITAIVGAGNIMTIELRRDNVMVMRFVENITTTRTIADFNTTVRDTIKFNETSIFTTFVNWTNFTGGSTVPAAVTQAVHFPCWDKQYDY